MRREDLEARIHDWKPVLVALGVPSEALHGRNCPCPMCGGTDRFQYTNFHGRGNYVCRGCEPGDGWELLMGFRGWDFATAIREVEKVVGQPPRPSRNGEGLAKLWYECDTSGFEDYLRSRGLEQMPEQDVRYHNSLTYKHEDQNHTFPAMVSAVRTPSGKPVSLHRTYIGNVPGVRKKHLGSVPQGAAIRLFSADQVTLGVAEGIETALAARELSKTKPPVWATGDSGHMETFEWPDGLRHLMIFADNDESFTGQKAAYKLAHRAKCGKRKIETVDVFVPKERGDWLDVLNRKKSG